MWFSCSLWPGAGVHESSSWWTWCSNRSRTDISHRVGLKPSTELKENLIWPLNLSDGQYISIFQTHSTLFLACSPASRKPESVCRKLFVSGDCSSSVPVSFALIHFLLKHLSANSLSCLRCQVWIGPACHLDWWQNSVAGFSVFSLV